MAHQSTTILYKNILTPSVTDEQKIQLSRTYGDIWRCVSYNKWETIDDILNKVWKIEQTMRHPGNRTRTQVTTALRELTASHVILEKRSST